MPAGLLTEPWREDMRDAVRREPAAETPLMPACGLTPAICRHQTSELRCGYPKKQIRQIAHHRLAVLHHKLGRRQRVGGLAREAQLREVARQVLQRAVEHVALRLGLLEQAAQPLELALLLGPALLAPVPLVGRHALC